MDNTAKFTRAIKEKAKSLGFCGIGIVRAEELTVERNHLEEWIQRGYHGSMSWLSRNIDKRTNPDLIFPGVKSVITVALNYWNENNQPSRQYYGRISRYAYGKDYHLVLAEKLKVLLQWLQNQNPDIKGKVYVDTGPLMEKVWAAKSGMGWLGKNTNIIIKNQGSWVFIGILLVNISLHYDKPIKDYCGSCSACIDACPTKALTPYILNAAKCISYWTIEHRGAIPDNAASKFGNWIFGCDICQEVCPWNRFAEQTQISEFYPKKERTQTALHAWSKLTEEKFKTLFHHSPVTRTKYAGFMRNAAIALANTVPEKSSHQKASVKRKLIEMKTDN